MPADDAEKACGVHALDTLIHDDCPYCTQIRLAVKDEEISRLTTAWHAEMATEAAMRAEVERLRSEVERLKRLLGRDNPLECPVCGQIREANEVRCGQCTYRLDGSDGGDE